MAFTLYQVLCQLAEIFDGFFHVVRKRIDLAIHVDEELVGILQRHLKVFDGGQVRIVGQFRDTVQAESKFFSIPLRSSFPRAFISRSVVDAQVGITT